MTLTTTHAADPREGRAGPAAQTGQPVPDLSVLIVSHGHADFVRNCLDSLSNGALDGVSHEFIVIDNLDEAGFLDQIGGARDGLRLHANARRRGFGANMNQAAELAQGRVLLVLNPDTAFHAGNFAAALQRFEADPTCGIAAARLLNDDGTDQRNYRNFPTAMITLLRGLHVERWGWRPKFYRDSVMEDRDLLAPTAVDWVYGSFMLIRRSTFAALGGFDTGYFMYYEDVDLCYRAGRAGLSVQVYPDLVFIHHHLRSSAQRGGSSLRRHHINSFLRYLRRTHAYVFSPITARQPDPLSPGLRRLAPVAFAVLLAGDVHLGAVAASGLTSLPTGAFMPLVLTGCLLLLQFMLAEFQPNEIGDAPRRVVGVVESMIMAGFVWALAHLAVPDGVQAGPLLLFFGLSALACGLVTYLFSLMIPSAGARLAVIVAEHHGGLSAGVPVLPIGPTTVSMVVPLGAQPDHTAQTVAEAVRAGRVDAVLMVLPQDRHADALGLLHALSMFDLPVWHALRELGTAPGRALQLRRPLRSRAREALKRGLDLVFALMALTFLAVPMLIVAALIKLEDGGPVFFSQPRTGRNQRNFQMMKFRSMRADQSDRKGDQLTTRNDARITRIGAFLRKTSIDELPQLLNVIAGDMSIVGPRPLPVGFHYKGLAFETFIPEWHHRHRVRPGITGLSQLRGLRGTPDTMEDAVRMMTDRGHYDNLYIDNWTIWLDLRIILMTVLSGAFMSGAY